jgi:hypothetical protein
MVKKMTINKEEINNFKYIDMAISILLFLLIYNFDMTSTMLIFIYLGLAIYTLVTKENIIESVLRKDIIYKTTIFLVIYQIVQEPISFLWMILVLIFTAVLKSFFEKYGYPLDFIKSEKD